MVYKLTALVGLGRPLTVRGREYKVEEKEWIELIRSKTEITRERADVKIQELKQKHPNIIKVIIEQSGKVKLSNGSKRKTIATWEGDKWT
ncbi:hypothetical protein KAR91_44570 [Candidatus Pacearchaeota archaeon]|nr:hypothetical protein [Candidatus Pacearchaeota archaeon]